MINGQWAISNGHFWSKFESKMSNPKLETLNSNQTQMSKRLNSKPIIENSKLPFEFYVLHLLRI
jgi:outer membrane receptor for ferrienterochelin and colicin